MYAHSTNKHLEHKVTNRTAGSLLHTRLHLSTYTLLYTGLVNSSQLTRGEGI